SKTALDPSRRCFSAAPESESESISSISSNMSGVADGALRLLTRKRNFLSGDQFSPERMSSGNPRFSDSMSRQADSGRTTGLMSTQYPSVISPVVLSSAASVSMGDPNPKALSEIFVQSNSSLPDSV